MKIADGPHAGEVVDVTSRYLTKAIDEPGFGVRYAHYELDPEAETYKHLMTTYQPGLEITTANGSWWRNDG